jgi:hypothetical protein
VKTPPATHALVSPVPSKVSVPARAPPAPSSAAQASPAIPIRIARISGLFKHTPPPPASGKTAPMQVLAARKFSTPWKIVFHTVEKWGCFFHTMENFSAIFPHHGKNLSTLWKNPPAAEAAGYSRPNLRLSSR